MTSEMGVYPLWAIRKVCHAASSHSQDHFVWCWLTEAKLIKEIRYGKGFPFPALFWDDDVRIYGPTFILPLILAVILSGLMRKHRISEYEGESVKMPFGSLTRRALSQIIDFFVLSAPAIAGALLLYPIFDMEKMINLYPCAGRARIDIGRTSLGNCLPPCF